MLSDTFLASDAIVLVYKLNLKDSEYYSNKFYYMVIFNRCYCDSEAQAVRVGSDSNMKLPVLFVSEEHSVTYDDNSM